MSSLLSRAALSARNAIVFAYKGNMSARRVALSTDSLVVHHDKANKEFFIHTEKGSLFTISLIGPSIMRRRAKISICLRHIIVSLHATTSDKAVLQYEYIAKDTVELFHTEVTACLPE